MAMRTPGWPSGFLPPCCGRHWSPEGHPFPLSHAIPSVFQLPCGRAKASGCPPAPSSRLRATPASPEKCQGLNAGARGQREGDLPGGLAAMQGTPAALGQGYCGEGMPPGVQC